jgi:hypothetical protein
MALLVASTTENRRFLTPAMPFVNLVVGQVNLGAIPNFLQSFSHELFVDGVQGKLTASFFDPEYDLIEDLIIQDQRTAFEYGWLGGWTSEKREGVLLTYAPRFEAEGAYLDVTVTDFALRGMKEVQSEIHQGKIDEIVTRLLARNNLTPDVQPTGDEPGEYQQTNITDLRFIDTVLKPLAKGADDSPGWEFRVDGRRAYFGPPVYQQIKRRFLFARDQMGDVVGFSPAFNGQLILYLGGGSIRVESYDWLAKQNLTQDVSLDAPPAALPQIAPETHDDPPAPGGISRYYSVPFQRLGDVQAWAASKFAATRRMAWEAVLTTLGDPRIVPGDLLEVFVLKRGASLSHPQREYQDVFHYTSGVYRVVRVTHKIQAGSFVSEMNLQSDGARYGVTPNPGVPPELADFDEDDARTYLTVDAEAEAGG